MTTHIDVSRVLEELEVTGGTRLDPTRSGRIPASRTDIAAILTMRFSIQTPEELDSLYDGAYDTGYGDAKQVALATVSDALTNGDDPLTALKEAL